MGLYEYLGQGTLKHNGRQYGAGDVLELTEEQAALLGPDVREHEEEAPVKEAPAPRHRATKAKE